jgi:hypothetical protein
MIEQKRKALADILAVDESEVTLGPFGYVVNTCTYEVLFEEEEIQNALESELKFERECIEADLEDTDYEWLLRYIDFDKYFRDQGFSLEDYGFNKHKVNDIIYYVREV